MGSLGTSGNLLGAGLVSSLRSEGQSLCPSHILCVPVGMTAAADGIPAPFGLIFTLWSGAQSLSLVQVGRGFSAPLGLSSEALLVLKTEAHGSDLPHCLGQ